jgi:DNA-binding response OmpR family regulator
MPGERPVVMPGRSAGAGGVTVMRIVVVEDERTLAEFVASSLSADGHSVVVAHDGTAGQELALGGDVDLVLLDVVLPGRSGLDVLRAVRSRRPHLPVILLTARDDLPARVEGLDLGADDYVTKPFWLEELRARVRARLRGPGQSGASRLEAGDLVVDLTTRRVLHAGHEVELTAREYALLVYLLRHPDQVLSREQLLHAVWGLDFDPRTKVLDVYVGYLRRKLAVGGRPAPIETVRQVGYRLRVRDA